MTLRKLTFSISLLAASLMLAATAHGEDIRSESFAKLCESEIGYCLSYVIGVEDGLKHGTIVMGMVIFDRDITKTKRVGNNVLELIHGCWPKGSGLSNEQRTKIWLKYLDDNPSELHKAQPNTYFQAMKEAFPCK